MEENTELKKISVVIPMYNAKDTIVRALNSVISQTYQGVLEIIVVNDGSKDNSPQIVEDFISKNPQINLKLINQLNGGVSKARNTGLRNATGEYIALLDSDDEWMTNKIQRQFEILRSHNFNIDFLGCARNNEELILYGNLVSKLHKVNPKELLYRMFPQTSTALFKKKLYDKEGGYNESMTHAEDGELWFRYCMFSEFYYLPESLVITGDGKPSFGFSGLSANLKEMFLGNLKILKLAKKKKVISKNEFFIFLIYYYIKHIRRVILTKIR